MKSQYFNLISDIDREDLRVPEFDGGGEKMNLNKRMYDRKEWWSYVGTGFEGV